MKKGTFVLLQALALGACAHTVPVVAFVKGQTLRGTATASLSGSHFEVHGQGVSCAGTYNGLSTSLTIVVSAICNDGRTAIITATREESGIGGGGRIRLSDGSEGDFIFGPAAERL